MMNLALTDQFGISHAQIPANSLPGAKQRRSFNLALGADRFFWIPAAILAFGLVKKYAAPSTEHLNQIPAEVTAQHHPDLLTRIREAGW